MMNKSHSIAYCSLHAASAAIAMMTVHHIIVLGLSMNMIAPSSSFVIVPSTATITTTTTYATSTQQKPPVQQQCFLAVPQTTSVHDDFGSLIMMNNDVVEQAAQQNHAPLTWTTTTTLLLGHENDTVFGGAFDLALFLPVIGSSLIMLTIVGLLYMWEESVEWVREAVPQTLLPVVESILAEIGGLGFIGLVLQTLLGNSAVKESLEEISIFFFGETDILIENFEFLHAAFFQVGVGFFLAAGLMVVVGLQKLKEIETVEGLQLDQETGACTVTAEKLSKYLPTPATATATKEEDGVTVTSGSSSSSSLLWDEIFMSKEERAAKSLLMRSRFMDLYPHLPDTFRVESIISASFAQNLYKMVEVSPLTWIFLIPALAFANAIDLSHEVVNAASPNAIESVGYFFSTFASIGPATFTVVLAAVWGFWNCWKVTQIKYMLLPSLGSDPTTGNVDILPAPIEDKTARESFNSSPAWVQPIENIWAKPSQNEFDDLFGTAGGAGFKLYQNSIKYQTWLCLTHIVFFGTQIVPRDIDALISGATNVGDPSHLTAELVTYGGFILASLLQLILVSPRAFWNYCLVACVEEKNSLALLELSGNPPPPTPPQPLTLSSVVNSGNATAAELS